MHFLNSNSNRTVCLGKPRAAVEVALEKQSLVIQPHRVSLAKADTIWLPIPSSFIVKSIDGKTVEPSRGKAYYVSAETIDPYHLVAEF